MDIGEFSTLVNIAIICGFLVVFMIVNSARSEGRKFSTKGNFQDEKNADLWLEEGDIFFFHLANFNKFYFNESKINSKPGRWGSMRKVCTGNKSGSADLITEVRMKNIWLTHNAVADIRLKSRFIFPIDSCRVIDYDDLRYKACYKL